MRSCAACSGWPCFSRELDWVAHRGPFQPRPFCDSVWDIPPKSFWAVLTLQSVLPRINFSPLPPIFTLPYQIFFQDSPISRKGSCLDAFKILLGGFTPLALRSWQVIIVCLRSKLLCCIFWQDIPNSLVFQASAAKLTANSPALSVNLSQEGAEKNTLLSPTEVQRVAAQHETFA